MSVALANENGYVGSLATNQGYNDLLRVLRKGTDVMKDFAQNGRTIHPDLLAKDIFHYLSDHQELQDDVSTLHTLRNLATMLQHTKEIAIVTES